MAERWLNSDNIFSVTAIQTDYDSRTYLATVRRNGTGSVFLTCNPTRPDPVVKQILDNGLPQYQLPKQLPSISRLSESVLLRKRHEIIQTLVCRDVLLCRNNATINAHVKTHKRVKHRVWHTDPWPDPTRPKSLTRWPVIRRPGSISDSTWCTVCGVKCVTSHLSFVVAWFVLCCATRRCTWGSAIAVMMTSPHITTAETVHSRH